MKFVSIQNKCLALLSRKTVDLRKAIFSYGWVVDIDQEKCGFRFKLPSSVKKNQRIMLDYASAALQRDL